MNLMKIYRNSFLKYRQHQDHRKELHKNKQVTPVKHNKESIEKTETPQKFGRHDLPKKHKLSLKAVKSRELRAGVVYYDCDCYHRNGLQHDCPRGGCGGLKHCVAEPWPNCDLSRYFKDKWGKYNKVLDLIPPTTYCGPRDAFLRAKIENKNNFKTYEKDKNKLNKPQKDLVNTKEKPTKRDEKKTSRPKKCQSLGRNIIECRKVHENVVQQYAIIPVAADH